MTLGTRRVPEDSKHIFGTSETDCTYRCYANTSDVQDRTSTLSTTRSGGPSRGNTAKCSCPLTRLRAKQHQQLHRHAVTTITNEVFLQNPMAIRITLPVLRSPRGDLEPPIHRSSLGATRPYAIGPFIACRLAFFWAYRDLSPCHLGRDTSLMVENGMAQSRCCLDPRPGLALGGSLNGLFGLDEAS